MVQDRSHRSFLQFLRRVIDVPLGYSFDELLEFRRRAKDSHPSVVMVIESYLDLTERSQTSVAPRRGRSHGASDQRSGGDMHLFDLLREKRLFPSNNDLSQFAGRVLPTMNRSRFDKMSRADIAARIIEYLETLDPKTRENLQSSMREAVQILRGGAVERKSFCSKWENIDKDSGRWE